ncbi:MAG: HD domain-containing phosphohydrolase [Planctomycetota bacterium]
MPVLRVKSGPDKGKVYEVREQVLEIGRDAPGGVQIMDQGVSRRHAEIVRIGELYFVKDLESTNGTFVNEKRVTEEILRIGDHVRIGNTVLVFEDRRAQLRDSSQLMLEERGDAGQTQLGSTIRVSIRRPGERGEPGTEGRVQTPEARSLEILCNLAYLSSEEKDLSRLLERASEHIGKALGADHLFVLWLRDEPGNRYEILGRFDRDGDTSTAACVSNSIVKECMAHGRGVLTSDATLDGQFQATASVVMKQLRSVICVPIPILGRNVGALYVYSGRPEAFSAEDLSLASAVGMQLGTTVGLLKAVQRSDRFFRNSLRTLVAAIEMKDKSQSGRAERVAGYCLAIAKELGLETHEVRNAWLAGLLHDIGSIPLSDKDREHTVTLETKKNKYARDLLSKVPDLNEVLPAILDANERHDGSGSPEGKSGDQISILGRILGLALELDKELYHSPAGGELLTVKDALLKLKELADKKFDRKVVNALLLAYRNGKLFNEAEEFFELPLE